MAEALRRPPEIAGIACVSIVETAADKFVGLTRRAGAELSGALRRAGPRRPPPAHLVRAGNRSARAPPFPARARVRRRLKDRR
jgi:hypothetical protein